MRGKYAYSAYLREGDGESEFNAGLRSCAVQGDAELMKARVANSSCDNDVVCHRPQGRSG